MSGEVELRDGDRALLSLSAAHEGPLLFPAREELEHRLDDTAERWRAWLAGCPYDGPWRDAVERSLLALKLLVYQASGGLLAAATTSLPEAIGGERNYDYRFAWVRDATFALDALLEMEMRADAHRSFSWLLDATRHTHPRLQPLYRLDGHPPAGQRELELPGYRGSRPVHEGNGAAGQPQHGNYADMLDTAWLYVRSGAALDEDSGRRLAQVADLACDLWRTPDSGIWELPEERNYTMSKISCWVAFDRALKLAEAGEVPDGHAPRWRDAASEVRAWVLERCWSEQRGAFTQAEDGDELDASVLLGVRTGFLDGRDERMAATIEAVRRELGAGGKLLYRYSGMGDEEGAFVACSFWLAEALARSGRADEAAETIDGMLGHANDLALYSEEVDPSSGELLGNFPQGLSHLALLNAVAQHRNAVGDD